MKSIYIIGAQCTGKTTLVNALENRFKGTTAVNKDRCPLVIREVARKVLEEKRFNRIDITTSPERAFELQQHILAAQYDAETTACLTSPVTWYLCDRSGLDPIAYTKCFVGEDAAAEMLSSEIWQELESRMKKGIVILCEAGCRWLTDDGVRLMPKDVEDWMRVDVAFRDLLKTRGIRFSILSKDVEKLEDRIDCVHSYVEMAQRETSR
jgi:nicotinamide riboside kinase